MNVRTMEARDSAWADTLVAEHFGSARIVSRGLLRDARQLSGLVAEAAGEPAGVLLYDIRDGEFEVVVLIATRVRRGVGRLLLNEAGELARQRGCTRAWLVTTNDNEGAIAFYRAVGWCLVAIHEGAVDAARALKPEIPRVTGQGVPIRDEIEFELSLL